MAILVRLLVALLVVSVYFFRVRLRLSHIPGPFLASLTNIHRRRWVTTGRAQAIHTELHRKYGKVVRAGPNTVFVSDPVAIPAIYRFNEPYQKVFLPYAYSFPTEIKHRRLMLIFLYFFFFFQCSPSSTTL
jgi:hypothetical protein